MATTTAKDFRTSAIAPVARNRTLGVGGAVVAAVAIWLIAVPLLGVHLVIRFGSGAPQTIGVGYVVGATLIASLAGWGLLAILERRTSRARGIWTVAALVVLAISLSLPLTAGISGSTKVVLALMHIAVAAVLIPALRSGSAPRNRA